MKSRAITLVQQEQFGYHTDTYYYAKHLRDSFHVNVVCWDFGLRRCEMENVHVHLVARSSLVNRTINLIEKVRHVTSDRSRDQIVYIKQSALVPTLLRVCNPKIRTILDIRSGSVEASGVRRFLENLLMRLESKRFEEVSVISDQVASNLKIKYTVAIPLGATAFGSQLRTANCIRALYVGTFYNRNLNHALDGFGTFSRTDTAARMDAKLTIVGSGTQAEEKQLYDLVQRLSLEDKVSILPAVPHPDLEGIFKDHNIGLSYIPIRDYYDLQPPTKTYEYLANSMPVIATATSENRKAISSENGVLVGDSALDVERGFHLIADNIANYDFDKIGESARQKYNWDPIVCKLEDYLNSNDFGSRSN